MMGKASEGLSRARMQLAKPLEMQRAGIALEGRMDPAGIVLDPARTVLDPAGGVLDLAKCGIGKWFQWGKIWDWRECGIRGAHTHPLAGKSENLVKI